MRPGRVFLTAIVLFFSSASTIPPMERAAWHYPLYLANLGYWHSRIPVEITNSGNIDFAGEPVKLKTGRLPGQLNIEGLEAGSLRLVDSRGTGLLFRITSPSGAIINEGTIPEKSEFIMPVTVKKGKSATLYLYADNASAWPTGAVLEGNPSEARHHKRPEIAIRENTLQIKVKPTENITLNETVKEETWPAEKGWNIRVPLRIFNFSPTETSRLPVYIKMDQIYRRLHYLGCSPGMVHLENKSENSYSSTSSAILLDEQIDHMTVKNVFSYFSSVKEEKIAETSYHDWFNDKRNLLGHYNDSRNEKAIDSTWQLDIPVLPLKTYMFGALVRSTSHGEPASIRIEYSGKDGKKSGYIKYTNQTDTDEEWTFVSGISHAPDSSVSARLRLNPGSTGKVIIKAAIVMEVLEGFASSDHIFLREDENQAGIKIWPVNPVVKVFREDLPPKEIPAAEIFAARNESEPLQIAIRSSVNYKNLSIEVTSPVNQHGKKIENVATYMEGYVPVDYPSNYYEKKVPYWYLKFPEESPGSDGWQGFWPDPLLPIRPFDLERGKTQPFWIEVKVPAGTESGLYQGKIILRDGNNLVGELPWRIRVRDFSLPERTSFAALYDYRPMEDMPEPGREQCRPGVSDDSLRNMHMSFMAQHRICTGEIDPVPQVKYKNGVANIDFTEYDKAAKRYFEEFKNPFAYLPVNIFYLFGWAFPPSDKFGEKPYEGAYPYRNVDRSKLRPEYKKAYQAVLKEFWDHLKSKGWADRYILYLSDEPHEADNENGGSSDIKIQMKALCDMIHEVDPEIPVYVSTWWYRPEWEGYINIWGLGYNGEGDYGHYVTAADMKLITSKGGRIWYTTDGNFCTETPYLALERLLPWFGYKYGAEAYEFWGVNWLTYNPFKYGWHSYIFESQAPGEESWKRYPNGDGYIIYPGKPVGVAGLVGSIRLKQVREGAEDYEYLSLLGNLIGKADPANPALPAAKKTLQQAMELVNIPCAMGRYSTKILKNPDEILRIREEVAADIEALSRK